MAQELWVFEPDDHFLTVDHDGTPRLWVVDMDGRVRVALDVPTRPTEPPDKPDRADGAGGAK